MLLKNSDKSMISRCIFRLWRRGWLPVGRFCQWGGVSVGCATDLHGVGGFEGFCNMGVCLSLRFGMRRDGFLQNIADKPGKSAPRAILPKRRHKNCFLALAMLVGQEACWLVRTTRLPTLVARRLGLSKSDYQKQIICFG